MPRQSKVDIRYVVLAGGWVRYYRGNKKAEPGATSLRTIRFFGVAMPHGHHSLAYHPVSLYTGWQEKKRRASWQVRSGRARCTALHATDVIVPLPPRGPFLRSGEIDMTVGTTCTVADTMLTLTVADRWSLVTCTSNGHNQ